MAKNSSNQMWGGRFSAGPDAIIVATTNDGGVEPGASLRTVMSDLLPDSFGPERLA